MPVGATAAAADPGLDAEEEAVLVGWVQGRTPRGVGPRRDRLALLQGIPALLVGVKSV